MSWGIAIAVGFDWADVWGLGMEIVESLKIGVAMEGGRPAVVSGGGGLFGSRMDVISMLESGLVLKADGIAVVFGGGVVFVSTANLVESLKIGLAMEGGKPAVVSGGGGLLGSRIEVISMLESGLVLKADGVAVGFGGNGVFVSSVRLVKSLKLGLAIEGGNPAVVSGGGGLLGSRIEVISILEKGVVLKDEGVAVGLGLFVFKKLKMGVAADGGSPAVVSGGGAPLGSRIEVISIFEKGVVRKADGIAVGFGASNETVSLSRCLHQNCQLVHSRAHSPKDLQQSLPHPNFICRSRRWIISEPR